MFGSGAVVIVSSTLRLLWGAVMLERPSRVYRVVLPLLVVALALSFVGKDNTPSDGGTYWIGAGGWFAFGVLLLVTLVFTVAVAVRAVARPGKTSGVRN